ncbi:MAG: protein kinase, partial [Gloeobacteraceae cyanobacterium ES-bin-144]|nr:protein kinase [Verrucomicrobiales bacterium]
MVKLIAEGRTGAAYAIRSVDNPHLLLCLKTIRQSITDAAKRDEVRDTLKKEVEILSPLRHRCLPEIFASNIAHPDLPYYISTFHPGQKVSEFKRETRPLQLREAFFVVASLIDVLKYLHAKSREHCDLHSGNVLISHDVFRDGVMMIDFGSGHRGSDTTPETLNRGNALLKDHDGLRLDRQIVDRHEARAIFVATDMIGLGSLLQQMEDVFLHEASEVVREEYRQLCFELRNGQLRQWEKIEERFDLVVDPYRTIGRNADLFHSTESFANAVT